MQRTLLGVHYINHRSSQSSKCRQRVTPIITTAKFGLSRIETIALPPCARRSEGFHRSRFPGAMQRAALAKRCFAEPGPGFFESQATGARLCSAPLREVLPALRPGQESEKSSLHEYVNVSLSPSPKPRLSCSCPVQRGGASRGDPEVGQSESWPSGATRRSMRRLGACFASTVSGGPGFPSGP
jgi:hypothetical protein